MVDITDNIIVITSFNVNETTVIFTITAAINIRGT